MDLILLACLIAAPADCHEARLPILADLAPPMACLAGAQATIAQWTAAHPRYRVERYRCVPSGRQEYKA